MADPLTITATLALAGKCINGVTKAVTSGKELESAMGHISRWMECVSDINAAERRAKKPSLFKKLTDAKSVEKEAFEALRAKRAMAEGRKQIYELVTYSWGRDAWNDLVRMERNIRAERKRQVHAQAELRRKASDILFIFVGTIIIIGLVVGFVWILSLGG